MRLISIMNEFNISLDTVYDFLIENGFQLRKSTHQKIDAKQYEIIENKFEVYRKEKIKVAEIEFVEIEYESNYQKTKKEAFERYDNFCLERNRLNTEIELLNNREQKYWALDPIEIKVLLNIKKEQLSSNLDSVEDIIEYFENFDEGENLKKDDLDDEDEYEDEIEDDLHRKIKYNIISDSNSNDWASYKSRDENPWVDVFGPGDEAETAYWNTD